MRTEHEVEVVGSCGLLKRKTLDADGVQSGVRMRLFADDPKWAVADSAAHARTKALHHQAGIPLRP
jgi:hypothetical protein